ncbi:MAG: hypothetical protein RBR67_20250 [Desulfobacterium sp.]|jgi:hypothetical protein|nr:hypothetical protein [Desulfobacterium sp.]
MNEKEIGGYFELESNLSGEFHTDAVKLNSGRHCLRYILQAQKPSKVFVPYYCCDSVLEPLQDEGIAYEYYHIDDRFEIKDFPALEQDQLLLYVNYFGLKTDYAVHLSQVCGSNLILDYTQAFFCRPIKGIDIFYSPRKFFGVPDGGYLYTEKINTAPLERDTSLARFNHLVGRLDKSATAFYGDFGKASATLSSEPIKQMSKVTQHILNGIDYSRAQLVRERNFYYLHTQLKETNLLRLDLGTISGPMIYPYLTDDPNLRQRLIASKIYVATYWPELKSRVEKSSTEGKMVEYLMPLPIDQRYKINEIKKIVEILN